MKKMLVLLNRPEDIEGQLSELKEVAKTQGIAKISLERVLRPFRSKVRSIVAPHKLDIVVGMGNTSAMKYLPKITDDFHIEGIVI